MKNKLDSFMTSVQTVAIAGHVRPDGDCAGSCLATYNYLKDNYPSKTIHLYLEEIPQVFAFLERSGDILHSIGSLIEYDLFIAQDCGDIDRLGDFAVLFQSAKETICVDHHISNQSFAATNFIFPEASSTSELIFELMQEDKITMAIAECLYVGMVHDTGVFQYSNTSAKTMEIAGKLMEKKIDFSKIVDETFYEKTFQQNQALGKALIVSSLYLEGKVIASFLTLEDMEKCQVTPKDLDGIVSQLRITKGTEVAIFLYENQDHTYKVSTRSSKEVNVSQIATYFGGGGHVKAAGFTMSGEPHELISLILTEIEKQLFL